MVPGVQGGDSEGRAPILTHTQRLITPSETSHPTSIPAKTAQHPPISRQGFPGLGFAHVLFLQMFLKMGEKGTVSTPPLTWDINASWGLWTATRARTGLVGSVSNTCQGKPEWNTGQYCLLDWHYSGLHLIIHLNSQLVWTVILGRQSSTHLQLLVLDLLVLI